MASSDDQEKYIMEANEGEIQRLGDQHNVLKSFMGTLTLAPVDFSQPNLRILDSGTADGLWLRELQESIKTPHTYIGTDIVPSFFPKHLPPGMELQIQSITQDWPSTWDSTFDYVHQRLTLAGAGQSSLRDCVSRLIGLVKPGGWIELIEADFTGESTNGPVMKNFESMMKLFLGMVGVGYDYAVPMKSWLEDAELETVGERTFEVEYGAACKDGDVARRSIAHLVTASRGLREFTKGQVDVSLSEQEMEDFPAQVKKELEERGAHFKIVGVWAQKPIK